MRFNRRITIEADRREAGRARARRVQLTRERNTGPTVRSLREGAPHQPAKSRGSGARWDNPASVSLISQGLLHESAPVGSESGRVKRDPTEEPSNGLRDTAIAAFLTRESVGAITERADDRSGLSKPALDCRRWPLHAAFFLLVALVVGFGLAPNIWSDRSADAPSISSYGGDVLREEGKVMAVK